MTTLESTIDPLISRIGAALSRRPVSWRLIVGRGYTPAMRGVVRFADGASVFVKSATNDDTAKWLRLERRMYDSLGGQASFLPELIQAGEDEESGRPFLVLEDLSAAVWPPPWNSARVDAVLETFAAVRAAAPFAPADLPTVDSMRGEFASWQTVDDNPEPFLSTGLCTRQWLIESLPTLIAADAAAPLAGGDLLHMDVRSDNLCFRPNSGAAVFVDWNWASIGNGALDIAGWLPSLHDEGGPAPDEVLPGHGELAAILAGFWAARAGLPPVPLAPRVRGIQKRQAAVALPWAARALGLPPPVLPYGPK